MALTPAMLDLLSAPKFACSLFGSLLGDPCTPSLCGRDVFPSRFSRELQGGSRAEVTRQASLCCWAEAHIKIARMTLTIKLDGNWSSFQLANSAPPLSVTGSAIAPSARMLSELPPVHCLPRHLFLCVWTPPSDVSSLFPVVFFLFSGPPSFWPLPALLRSPSSSLPPLSLIHI